MNEPFSAHPQIAAWLARVRALSVDIGPRGPTREGERKAAQYAQAEFEKMGLKPAWETFQSARSIFHPHLLGSSLMLAAFIVFPLGGRLTGVLSALISLLVLVSELQELGFQDNLFRRLVPKAESQNVYAVLPPAGEHRRDLVLAGHMDTQRTPIIFQTPGWVKVYDRYVTVTFITFILQVVLYALAVFLPWGWIWYATIPTAACALLLAAICLHAEATPFTAGANDNATAVGLVLTLAEQLAQSPLQHTRVFAVCTGCEEVQHYGMVDFYRRHRAEMKNPKAIVFEMLGCAGPAWLEKEGIIIPFKADPDLKRTVEQLAADHPDWDAYPASISGGNTEMADAVRYKVPAITIFGMTREGVSPYWHQVQDTFDKMDPVVMEKNWQMSWALIQSMDE